MSGFVTKSEVNKGVKSMTGVMEKYVAPLGGGIAGFMAADSFLGVKGLFQTLISDSGIMDAFPIVGSFDIASFVAAGIYAAAGAVVSAIKMGGTVMGILFGALSWYCYGAALRLAIEGLIGGITTIKTSVVA